MLVACPGEGPLTRELTEAAVDARPWPSRRTPGPWAIPEAARLARVVADFAPDVVHLHSSKAGLAGRLAVRGRRPTLFQPHAWSFDVGGVTGRLARIWERAAARWTTVLVCVSRAELEAGRAAGVAGRAEVVPNGVDLERFAPGTDADRSAARERLRLAADPLVVCVGRLSRQKGQDLLLAAWPVVREAIPTARLVLVGDGPERGALEQKRPAGVDFAGRCADVRDWLLAADVVALPSRYEGLALTLLEAMASARSVVAHDVAGVRETLAPPDRRAGGAIVAVGDRVALASAIVARLREQGLAAAEGEAGRRLAEENHDLARWADRLCRLTEDVVAGRGSP